MNDLKRIVEETNDFYSQVIDTNVLVEDCIEKKVYDEELMKFCEEFVEIYEADGGFVSGIPRNVFDKLNTYKAKIGKRLGKVGITKQLKMGGESLGRKMISKFQDAPQKAIQALNKTYQTAMRYIRQQGKQEPPQQQQGQGQPQQQQGPSQQPQQK